MNHRIPAKDYGKMKRESNHLRYTRTAIACNIPMTYGVNLHVFAMEDGLAFVYHVDEDRPQWLNSARALMRIVSNPKVRASIAPAARDVMARHAPTILTYLEGGYVSTASTERSDRPRHPQRAGTDGTDHH